MKSILSLLVSVSLMTSTAWGRTNPFAPTESEQQHRQEQEQMANAAMLANCINRLVRGGMLASAAQAICHDVLSSLEEPQDNASEPTNVALTLQRCVERLRGQPGIGRNYAVLFCQGVSGARPELDDNELTGDYSDESVL